MNGRSRGPSLPFCLFACSPSSTGLAAGNTLKGAVATAPAACSHFGALARKHGDELLVTTQNFPFAPLLNRLVVSHTTSRAS